MPAFSTPMQPAFRFHRSAGAAPAADRPQATVEPVRDPPTLRPAVEVETRLLLRDLGWSR